ncbi:beta-glucosidase 3 isoform X3 [Raphanus sativus]|uniref:Sinigrinase n=1 Tax=Raphanus sativus TaxID=3726 RepID=A0A9W3DB58_RAPSA|nr:beta-glucosidase 3 isoform X3 [Raphanus sativus]
MARMELLRCKKMDMVLSLIITISLALPFTGSCSSHVYSRRSDFPEGFAFGSGASSYQWEGAADEDGRKPSIWDTFVHSRNLDNGDIACDGYHKYKEDVQLMVETGLDAFRFSISWSRLIPNGRGPVNPKGLYFYKSFIQQLVTHGIEPHVTLYHYDHPQALEDDYGGWLNRTIIKDFTAYADVCFREFGNHVKLWTTINEANIFTIGGYNDGITAPGRCSRNCMSGNSSTEPYIVGHNLLLAHASASRLYQQKYKRGSVGFGLFAMGFSPSTTSKDDEIATQRARDFYFGWMLGPLVYGGYPYVMRRTIGSRLPDFSEEESELVKGSSDFVGITHYNAAIVTNIKPYFSGYSDFYSDTGITLTYPCNDSSTGLLLDTCDDTPWAMEGVLEYIKQSYDNSPVYILENGKSMKGDFQLQQKDTPRIDYLQAYIGAVLKAVRNGSDTRGYFVWSLMDLYELLDGYGSAFGLYYVNFSDPQRKRSPKHSAHWYSAFLKDDITFRDSQGITQLQSNISSF